MKEEVDIPELSALETQYWATIQSKDKELRAFLSGSSLVARRDPAAWFLYLSSIRDILGNLSNSLSYVSTLLVKDYLVRRFGPFEFDAAFKPQGARGIDVEVVTPGGVVIAAEIKTTKPYQPGFGAAQKTAIVKDLERLAGVTADHRIMFVTDDEAFRTLCSQRYRNRFPNVEVVNAMTGASSTGAL
jgi:hypothetical protein